MKFLRKIIFPVLMLAFFQACFSNKTKEKDKVILLAHREAPLGWLYLKLYKDKKFDFVSKGLRSELIYPGTFRINADTVFLTFKDTVPQAGDDTLLIKGMGLSYQNNHGGLVISVNKLPE